MHLTLIIGFILGILSAVFFALYMVPQKLARVDHTTFLWTMGMGVLITAFVPYALHGFPAHSTLQEKGLAIMCGVIWGIGTLSLAASIQRIGLALATPIKNTTGVLGTLVGLVFLGEWKTTDPWFCLAGSMLIVLSAVVIGTTGKAEIPRRSTLAGIGLALVSACCYASYLYPLKLVVTSVGYWEFAPWMAAGIMVTATGAVLLRRGGVSQLCSYPLRAYGLSLLGGASWTIALFCLIISMTMVDLSVAWSLAQLNTLPAVFLGIMLFHEVDFRSQWGKVIMGLIAAAAGTILLGMAK
ncbi:MAG: GRP family sugar transporter [Armatimonadota bacterium]